MRLIQRLWTIQSQLLSGVCGWKPGGSDLKAPNCLMYTINNKSLKKNVFSILKSLHKLCNILTLCLDEQLQCYKNLIFEFIWHLVKYCGNKEIWSDMLWSNKYKTDFISFLFLFYIDPFLHSCKVNLFLCGVFTLFWC